MAAGHCRQITAEGRRHLHRRQGLARGQLAQHLAHCRRLELVPCSRNQQIDALLLAAHQQHSVVVGDQRHHRQLRQ